MRLYILKAELDSLKTAINSQGQPSGVASINEVDVFNNSDACAAIGSAIALPLTTIRGTYNSDYYLQVSVPAFSSFYFANDTLAHILPVTISSFTGKRAGAVNVLNWKSSCAGLNGFNIERSTDGIHFENIGMVPATVTDCSGAFSFIDHTPSLINYYRIRINENSVAVNYSPVILLQENKGGLLQLTIIPNIVYGNALNVRISSNIADRVELIITDLEGRLLMHRENNIQAGNNTTPINAVGLTHGVYWLYAIGKEGRSNVVKFVKE